MKPSTLSKIDKVIYYIQITVIVGVLLSYLIDPAFLLFGDLFSIPASLIILIYFTIRAFFLRSFNYYSKVIIISLGWAALSYWFVWYVLHDYMPMW